MGYLFLTQNSTPIYEYIVKALAWILNGIYSLGIHNLGVCIILFTIVIYIILTPFNIKQQINSRIMVMVSPEIQKIQKKYSGRRDQESQMKMQQETRAVYEKYGTSMLGGCSNLLITMPILFAFYTVIRNIPAYIMDIKNMFLVSGGIVPLIQNLSEENQNKFVDICQNGPALAKQAITGIDQLAVNNGDKIIDALWNFEPSTWAKLYEIPGLDQTAQTIALKIKEFSTFLCYNILESPMSMIKTNWESGQILLCIAALLIPIIAALSQFLNIKLTPQPAADGGAATTTKTMNFAMPLISLVFCFTLPIALGLYWILSAVIRSICQVLTNLYIDKVGIETIIEKRKTKKEAKLKRKGKLPDQSINERAKSNTRSVKFDDLKKNKNKETNIDKKENIKNYNNKPKEGSLASKADMVKNFNERKK